MSEDRRRKPVDLKKLDDFLTTCFQYPPVSVRNVYYNANMHCPLGIPKTKGEAERISERLVQLRRDERVSYEHVVEGGRVFKPTPLDESSVWFKAARYPIVIVESLSIRDMVRSVCDKYQVGISASQGQASVTLVHKIGQFFDRHPEQEPVVLYFGDFDSPGYNIADNYERSLAEHTKVNYEFRHLGLSREQIEQFSLPTNPCKAKHPKRADIPFNAEAEAMHVLDMRDVFETAILEYTTPEMLERAEQYQFAEEFDSELRVLVADAVFSWFRHDGENEYTLYDDVIEVMMR